MKLQMNLDKIAEWSALNRLKLNCDKCKVLSFGMRVVNAYALEEVNFHKNLGNIFESSFDFNRHVNAVTSQAFKSLGFIIRTIRKFRNLNAFV